MIRVNGIICMIWAIYGHHPPSNMEKATLCSQKSSPSYKFNSRNFDSETISVIILWDHLKCLDVPSLTRSLFYIHDAYYEQVHKFVEKIKWHSVSNLLGRMSHMRHDIISWISLPKLVCMPHCSIPVSWDMSMECIVVVPSIFGWSAKCCKIQPFQPPRITIHVYLVGLTTICVGLMMIQSLEPIITCKGFCIILTRDCNPWGLKKPNFATVDN